VSSETALQDVLSVFDLATGKVRGKTPFLATLKLFTLNLIATCLDKRKGPEFTSGPFVFMLLLPLICL